MTDQLRFISSLLYLFSSSLIYGQLPDDIHSPLCRISQRIGMTDIELSYSRPSLKGRALFGEILQAGKEWRTGANAATTIRFDDPVLLNGHKIKPGIYALYTIPGDNVWQIILNLDIYQDPFEGRNTSADALLFDVPVFHTDDPVETFTIFISDLSEGLITANLYIAWGNVNLKIPLEVPEKWEE